MWYDACRRFASMLFAVPRHSFSITQHLVDATFGIHMFSAAGEISCGGDSVARDMCVLAYGRIES